MSSDYISESLDGLIETMPMTDVRLLVINISLILIIGWFVYRIFKTNNKLLIHT